MIKNNKVLAIVPARGGSKGIPLKNLRKLNNKHLIYYSINAAKDTNCRSKTAEGLYAREKSNGLLETPIHFVVGSDLPNKGPALHAARVRSRWRAIPTPCTAPGGLCSLGPC